jgi:hypothetical protein
VTAAAAAAAGARRVSLQVETEDGSTHLLDILKEFLRLFSAGTYFSQTYRTQRRRTDATLP